MHREDIRFKAALRNKPINHTVKLFNLHSKLLNIISNAKLHAYPKYAPGQLNITLTEKIGRYIIAVQDLGCGIRKENLNQVFTAFYTTKRGQGGTGLGMSIMHSIVTSTLQGLIEISSTLGEGTTITISIPKQLK